MTFSPLPTWQQERSKIGTVSLRELPQTDYQQVPVLSGLGMSVEREPSSHSSPYALLYSSCGKGMWLVPVSSRRVAVSALHWVTLTARQRRLELPPSVKGSWLARLGMWGEWADHTLHLDNRVDLGHYFNTREWLKPCYFSHAEENVTHAQLCDRSGAIHGYAKVAHNDHAALQLLQEAEVLERLQRLQLITAATPRPVFAGDVGNTRILLTESLIQRPVGSDKRFTSAHRQFLEELEYKTRPEQCAPVTLMEVSAPIINTLRMIKHNLSGACQALIDSLLNGVIAEGGMAIPGGLTHGAFTPGSTCIVNGHLQVYQWQQASLRDALSLDLMHYIWCQYERTEGLHAADEKIRHLRQQLHRQWPALPTILVQHLIALYLLKQLITCASIHDLSTCPEAANPWVNAMERLVMSSSHA